MSALDPPDWQRDKSARPFEGTQLRRKWANRVRGDILNDFLIVVTPHSATAGSGTGKTTLALQLCKAFDQSDRGFDAEVNATLDAGALVDEVLENSQSGSALLWDEAQGAPGATGLDARRSMKSEPMDAIKGVLASRNQRHTLVVIGQQMGMFDSRLYPMCDAWLHIVEDPGQATVPTVVHYDLMTNDYDLSSGDIKSKNVEDLSWDPLPEDDPDYQTMDKLKEAAKTSDESDEDEEDERPISEIAQEVVNMDPETQANLISWHGGHHKWKWAQDRFGRAFDLSNRRARSLKDHLVEVTQLTPAQIADDADKEAPG
jgi:hypothetical protein